MLIIQLILQFAALFIILKYYMRRDLLSKVIMTYLMPCFIYVMALINVVPLQRRLLRHSLLEFEKAWCSYPFEYYIYVYLMLLLLFFLSSKLEAKLFSNLNKKVKLIDKIFIISEIVVNAVLLGYAGVYILFLRKLDEHFYYLFLFSLVSMILQLVMKLIVILFAGLEGEKRQREDIATKVRDIEWCRKRILKYIGSSYRLYGIITTLCGGGMLVLMYFAILDEGISEEYFFSELFMAVFALTFLIMGIIFDFKWLFPKTTNCWKRIKTWGYEEEILRLLCRELFDENHPPVVKYKVYAYTEHFVVSPVYLSRKIYYFPLVDKITYVNNNKFYNFKDGGKLKISLGAYRANELIGKMDEIWEEKRGVAN